MYENTRSFLSFCVWKKNAQATRVEFQTHDLLPTSADVLCRYLLFNVKVPGMLFFYRSSLF